MYIIGSPSDLHRFSWSQGWHRKVESCRGGVDHSWRWLHDWWLQRKVRKDEMRGLRPHLYHGRCAVSVLSWDLTLHKSKFFLMEYNIWLKSQTALHPGCYQTRLGTLSYNEWMDAPHMLLIQVRRPVVDWAGCDCMTWQSAVLHVTAGYGELPVIYSK